MGDLLPELNPSKGEPTRVDVSLSLGLVTAGFAGNGDSELSSPILISPVSTHVDCFR